MKPIQIVINGKDQTGVAFASLNRQIDGLRGNVGKLQGLFAGAFAGVSIAGTMSKFIQETRAAEQEQAQLAAVLRSTGEAAGWSQERLNEMAAALSGPNSTFSEGAITTAQTRLLSYTGIVGEQVPRAMQNVVDMSARLSMDLNQSAETIGKALDVPSQGMAALSKQGFRFTDDQKKLVKQLEQTGRTAEAQGIILDALESSYAGAAKAARDTFGGAISALQNNIDSLLTGDSGSMRQLKDAVEDVNRVLESEETRRAFQTLTRWMADLTASIFQGVTEAEKFISKYNEIRNLGAIDLVAKDAMRAMLPWGDPRMTGDHAGDLQRAAAERDALVARNTKALANARTSVEREVATTENAKRDRKIGELDRYIELLRHKQSRQATEALGGYNPDEFVPRPGAQSAPAQRVSAAAGSGGGSGSKSKKDVEAEAKRYLESLQKELEKTQQLSRVEQALLDIQRMRAGGSIVTEAHKQQMLRYAAEIDISKEREERLNGEERERDAARRLEDERWQARQHLIEQTRTPLEAYNAEVARLTDLLGGSAENEQLHARAMQQAIESYRAADDSLKTLNEQMDTYGQRAAENIQNQLGDGLYQTLSGNFDSIGKAWSDMLRRMIAEAAAAQLTRSLFGDLVKGGTGTGLIGKAFGAGGDDLDKLFASNNAFDTGGTWGAVTSLLGKLIGGSFDVGTNFVPQDMLAVIHKGEKIVPAKYNRAADPDAAQVPTITFAPVINIDARSDRAAVAADTQRIVAEAQRQFADQLKRVGVLPP